MVKLHCGDCLDVMRQMDDECVDLTVTSPPYDNLRTYNGNISQWNFKKFTEIAKELYRITNRGGVVVWIVSDKTENGSETGTSFRQALYFKEIGFNLHDTMIWRKTNPMPKVRTKRYFDVFEYMFVLSKGIPKTFNPIMQKCKCGGQEYNSTCKNMGGESGRTKKSLKINAERYADNIFDIAVAQNKTGHPAVFPLKIAQDHIISWSNENDVVFDPFMGSGTTGIACVNNRRNFIGCEICKEYFDISTQRIQSAIEDEQKAKSEIQFFQSVIEFNE